MAQLLGKNEGVDYIHKMVHQHESGSINYPKDTNMRGGAKAGGHRGENDVSHHAAGDMVMERKRGGHVEHEHHAMGGMAGHGFRGMARGIAHPVAMQGPQPGVQQEAKKGGKIEHHGRHGDMRKHCR